MDDNRVDEKDLKELEHDYKRMWSYLSASLYYRGGTRGHARQKALEQMDVFVRIKTSRDNRLNESLKEIHSRNRKKISENIMTSEHSNDVFIKRVFGNELVGERWATSADKEFKSAMRQFNEFYEKKYQPKQNNNKSEFDANKQRLVQMYIQMMLQKSREPRGR